MSKLLELLFSLSVAGSTVAICILLLRLISPNVFPAKWRYAIGKMAVGFYFLPIALVLQWLWPLFAPKQTTTAPIPGLHSSVQQTQSDLTTEAIPELNLSADAALVILSIWGAGALIFAIWQVYCYRKFINKLQQTRKPVPEISEAAQQLTLVKEALGMQSNVQLAYSSAIRSPVLVGLWKPTIYLPMEIANVDMGMVIHHELTHLKRKDLWVKAMTLAAGALHWFNPFIHILRKDIHTWSELSCDEEVVRGMSYAERKRYGETILNVVVGSRGMPVRICASLSGDGKQLKRRLMIMLNVKKLKKRTMIMAAAAVITVGAIGTTTAAWAAKNTPEVSTETNQTIERAGDSILINGVQYLKYGALTPDEQKFIIEEGIGAPVYILEGYEHPVFVDELTPEEQAQVTKEDGYYSPESIARLRESSEKFPRGISVTITHEEDPSIPSGTSMTIRKLTSEEIEQLEKMQAENNSGKLRAFFEQLHKK